jgi:hypothetical protein
MATANPTPTPEVKTEDRLKALETELAAERAKNSGTAELKQTVEQLNQKLTAAMTPPPPPPPKTDKPDFFVDPEGAVNAVIRPQMEALAANQLQQQSYLARQSAAGSTPQVAMAFRKWGAEIDEMMKGEGLVARANAIYWINAAKVVLANHIDEISGAAKSGKDFFLEGGAPGVAPGGGNEQKQRRQLTDSERRALQTFNRMGVKMSEEEYLDDQEKIMAGTHNER